MGHKKSGKRAARDRKGRFLKGQPGGPGRPKGSKNRYTDLKASFLAVLGELGGEEWMKETAEKYPVEFMRMLARMLPKATDIDLRADVSIGDEKARERARELIEEVNRRVEGKTEGGSPKGPSGAS